MVTNSDKSHLLLMIDGKDKDKFKSYNKRLVCLTGKPIFKPTGFANYNPVWLKDITDIRPVID